MSDFNLDHNQANMLVRLVETGPLPREDLGGALVRDSLVRLGLAAKIVFSGEGSWIAATELGSHIYRKQVVGRGSDLGSAIAHRQQMGVVELEARLQ